MYKCSQKWSQGFIIDREPVFTVQMLYHQVVNWSSMEVQQDPVVAQSSDPVAAHSLILST